MGRKNGIYSRKVSKEQVPAVIISEDVDMDTSRVNSEVVFEVDIGVDREVVQTVDIGVVQTIEQVVERGVLQTVEQVVDREVDNVVDNVVETETNKDEIDDSISYRYSSSVCVMC